MSLRAASKLNAPPKSSSGYSDISSTLSRSIKKKTTWLKVSSVDVWLVSSAPPLRYSAHWALD